MTAARTLALTALALVAFAANSILCRLALRDGAIDPVSFTTLRIAAGALMLGLLLGGRRRVGGDWPAAAALFAYALAFSLAYLELGAAVGALLLFGAVQLTMFAVGLARGERLDARRWSGVVLAGGGVAYLVAPGVAAPPPGASALMLLAGAAWGAYSLRGGASSEPVADTAGNFLRAVPLAAVASLLLLGRERIGLAGAGYALASGALASGLGYAVWYAALRGLDATRAATVQLAVPVLTAFGAVLLLDEALTRRLVVAGLVVLGGIALAVVRRR